MAIIDKFRFNVFCFYVNDGRQDYFFVQLRLISNLAAVQPFITQDYGNQDYPWLAGFKSTALNQTALPDIHKS